MRVFYNGFTGELMKLEREIGMLGIADGGKMYSSVSYMMSIYEIDKKVTHSFSGVKWEDVRICE